MTITEHVTRTARHTSFYLAAGPSDGPLIIFLHGWPELAISWRHQLPAMAALRGKLQRRCSRIAMKRRTDVISIVAETAIP